jgi:dTDP-4-amino-4,6-dideoxygalactose transaminase
MNVPLLDLSLQHQKLAPELSKAFEEVIAHGKFILGPEVELFEKETAKNCQVSYAISCASGSDALLLALMAYEIGPGDEVITTPYSFFATASCIARLGARAVFVDICPHCYNIHPAEVLKKINAKTKAIIPVHLYGQSADMAPYLEICKKRNIAIIEDACQAVGAAYQGKQVCTFGDIGCLSYFPSKNLGGFGDGGMMLTNDEELAKKLRILRVHGSEPKYYHHVLGINSRMDTLQAALLRVKLPHLSEYAAARNQNAAFYSKSLVEAGIAEAPLVHESCGRIESSSKPIILPASRSSGHVFNQYVIRTQNAKMRDALREHLKAVGIGTEIYYPVPLHLQKCFAFWGYREGDFPHSELAGHSTLAIPIYPELTETQLRYVVDALSSFSWQA